MRERERGTLRERERESDKNFDSQKSEVTHRVLNVGQRN